MNKYISMLRGINVSGQKIIKMVELKALYESLNFKNVTTYIQSGNVVFESPSKSIPNLVKKIESKIMQSYGYSVIVTIKTKADFQQVIDNNPYLIKRNEDTSKLHVTFLSDAPDKSLVKEIEKLDTSSDEFYLSEKEIYLFCPNGYGRTKLTNNFFEKKLKVSATTRNWKTVNKLFEMAG